ncbi:MAG: tRNA(m(1)G37)methyltransferase [Phylliscum demangeonii]|nr:MAG: tRNA(m(1)G37)methyltransferase [Phylliscum demangeonii]
MLQLDRALFAKRVHLTAARVLQKTQIGPLRVDLEKSRELLHEDRIGPVQLDPDVKRAGQGGKCLLLRPEIAVDDASTWSSALKARIEAEDINLIPYEMLLDYDHWTYAEVLAAIIPEDSFEGFPTGFAIAGHVAHLNLRSDYLPYKHLIAAVIVDKNPQIRTVINKIDDVGVGSPFRTFKYEVLAGSADLNVEVHSQDCVYRFDYSKVYWNTRLQTEHQRMVGLFQTGEAVCDVMAGVGPFAVPAGKKRVFVLANDLNPECYASLRDGIQSNKVKAFVRPYNEDGRAFIRHAVDDLLTASGRIVILPTKAKYRKHTADPGPPWLEFRAPPTFSHFIMNLPASAISFLDAFKGVYGGRQHLFQPFTAAKLPMIHVYCFSRRVDGDAAILAAATREICQEISSAMGIAVTPEVGDVGDVAIREVRDVAPRKSMFCASFRLPPEVAFGAGTQPA